MKHWGLAAIVVASAACGAVKDPGAADASTSSDSSPDLCPSMSCDDSNPCTTDACASSTCSHTPIPPAPGTQTINYTGTIVDFTVPACVIALTIDAFGGSGGNTTTFPATGGMGARAKGVFTVATGQLYKVLVGQAGSSAAFNAGGGGGTFVWNPLATAMPLIVAGGGGGAGNANGGAISAGSPGGATQNGGSGTGATTGGGVGGAGATPPNGADWAGGGAGWTSNGAPGGGADVAAVGCTVAGGGTRALAGGAGGQRGAQSATDTNAGPGGFGGGGSYNGGASQVNTAGANTGNGKIVFTW